MHRRLLVLLFALASVPTLGPAQPWRTVHQPATWVNVLVDEPIAARAALWFDGHWRRMGLGAEPQQVLLRPGAQFTLRPGLRVGAGYAFVATAPYGKEPIANPTREHRGWQQVSLAHRAKGLDFSHRLRWEQRWIAPLLLGDSLGPAAYQQRARYSVRAQRPLRPPPPGGHAVLAFVWNEYFLPVGHSDARLRRLQNRVGAGLGFPLDAERRVEVGYMGQWNRVTPRQTHEINHTLVLSLVHTGVR